MFNVIPMPVSMDKIVNLTHKEAIKLGTNFNSRRPHRRGNFARSKYIKQAVNHSFYG